MDKRSRGSPLFVAAIFLGMILGGVLGAIVGREIGPIVLVGDLFLAGLKMLIIPLVMSSIITGVTSMGDIRKLGRMGLLTLFYYLSTTIFAVIVGMFLVNIILPGAGVSESHELKTEVATYSFLDVIRGIVPANIVDAMASGQILPLIFFSLFFGITLTTVGEKGHTVLSFVEGIFEISMKMVRIVVAIAPVGVFALVATRIGRAGGWTPFAAELQALGWYALTVITGLLIHGVLILPGLLIFFGRRSPFRFVRNMAEPLILAFSTASSSATLPVTISALQDKARVDSTVGRFVLPLGATVNMDGTALYEAVAAVFIAQIYGIELTFSVQIVIVLTATLAAIGAAGIPEAGLVTMVMVLQAAGLPVEGIGMILAIDWFLDRCRTTVNVWGDATGAVVIERFIVKKK